jgi:aryl-alcohol dehydrogenase-like predicted oxidoreductase
MSSYSLGSVTVSRVGFGAMRLPGPGVTGPPRDRDSELAVLRRAVELSVNHIDTAQGLRPRCGERAPSSPIRTISPWSAG